MLKYTYATTVMGTKRSLASWSEAKSTIGPSAPPIMAMAAASLGSKPIATEIGKVKIVPSSAGMASNMLSLGWEMKKSMSVIDPIPRKTKHAIKPFEKVNA